MLVLGVAWPARAQLVVFDPANVARNTVTAILKEYLVNTQRLEREQIERMARRLSRLTDLRKVFAARAAHVAHSQLLG